MNVAILVPVLGRPQRVCPTLAAFNPHPVYFIPDYDDDDEIAEIESAGGNILYAIKANYALKINVGVMLTNEPLIFLGADDLEPQPDWFETAVGYIEQGAQVVGVNDMISRSRQLATHFLITREYAQLPTITGERGPLCELYDHSCIDDELIATAVKRDVYAYAEDARVKHLHPDMDLAPIDSTYVKGRKNIRADRRMWKSRRIWNGLE
jgi:hypothetical protein